MGPEPINEPRNERRNESTTAQIARAAGRLSSDPALRNRLLKAGVAGALATADSVKQTGRRLWLEVTGFLFVCLAVIGGVEVWRKWNTHEAAKLASAAAFAVVFGYFGVTSFWQARRPRPHRGGAEARRNSQ